MVAGLVRRCAKGRICTLGYQRGALVHSRGQRRVPGSIAGDQPQNGTSCHTRAVKVDKSPTPCTVSDRAIGGYACSCSVHRGRLRLATGGLIHRGRKSLTSGEHHPCRARSSWAARRRKEWTCEAPSASLSRSVCALSCTNEFRCTHALQ